MLNRSRERGQTMPFWVMGILVALTLTFFVSNYANTVKYQIHAQNAADSAATAALGKDAAALNSEQTLLAAFDIQELKVRDIADSTPFILGTNPCGAANLLTQTCTGALEGAATDLAASTQSLGNVANTINNFQTQLSGQLTDTLNNPSSTVNAFFAPNGGNGCSIAVLTDCDFKYSTFLTLGSNGLPTVDEYACKKITNVAASFLHLPSSTYYAIGRSTVTLAPASATYNASALGTGFQATSKIYPSITGSALVGDLSGLNINSAFFTTVGAPPPTQTHQVQDVCPA